MAKQQTYSIGTIQSLINAMIGGAMLILPILFVQGGLILSAIVLAISGLICYSTCQLYMDHLKPNEKDISDVILRVLGRKWYNLFNTLSCLYLFLIAMLYFLLLCDMFYQICQTIMLINGSENFAPKDEFAVDKFSLFYTSIIIIIPVAGLVFIKNMEVVNKITQYGVYAIYIYLFFILYVFAENLKSGNIGSQISKMPLFSMDIGHLAGTCSLAFTLHTAFVPILQQDPNYKRTSSNNLKLAYLGGFVIYFFIGCIGGLGTLGRKPFVEPPQSITEFFSPTQIAPLVVEFVYFMNLITVLPCFFKIFRQRFLSFIYEDGQIPDFANKIINIVYLIFAFVVRNIPAIRPGDILSANGAISCFFIVYLIPIFLHLKCYLGDCHTIKATKKSSKDNLGFEHPDNSIIVDNHLVNAQSSIDDNREELVCYQQVCNDHKDIDKYPKVFRISYYGLMFLIGLSIFVYGIYNLFVRDVEDAQTGRLPDNFEKEEKISPENTDPETIDPENIIPSTLRILAQKLL